MRRIVPFVLILQLLVAALPATGAAGLPFARGSAVAAEGEPSYKRYFGREPFEAVEAAAAATARSCTISDAGLAALVLAPVFKESSAATTPDTAPSPMTLSRYDEWSGVYSTSTNRDANYGLYAFRNPYTSYVRAYWHPGIGIWQYDSAGVGAPFTAVERMDVATMAADVAQGMAARYCAASGTNQDRRYAAWAPWGNPCTLCEGFFQELAGTEPRFRDLGLVDGIELLGGTVARTCILGGVDGAVPCWYVNPSVGVVQGATAWATFSVDGKGDPTIPPAPLSLPFYVIDRGATEERHWLREDTGYAIDISASRQIGKNARPRSAQSGSGLTWKSSSTLCDLTTLRGACVPEGPSPKRTVRLQVTDPFAPFSGDFDGDGLDDVFWYGAGEARDALWFGRSSGSFVGEATAVRGTYEPLVGDFDGDDKDDIFWYAAGGAPDSVWYGSSPYSNRVVIARPVKGSYEPLVADFDGDGRDDVFWYAPGDAPDALWLGQANRTFSPRSVSVRGTYRPLIGDFNGDGRGDIFWLDEAATASPVWYGQGPGSFASTVVANAIDGVLRPRVGDFDGDGRDDVFWYTPGSAPDAIWFGNVTRSFTATSAAVHGTYDPVVADLDGDGDDDIIWYAPGAPPDSVWWGSASRTFSSGFASIPSTYVAVIGSFDAGSGIDVLWYQEGQLMGDSVWLDP